MDKAMRVKNFVEKMHYGVGLIAHSCGVREPRELRRFQIGPMPQDNKEPPAIQTTEWSPDGAKIAAACADNLVRVWDVVSGKEELRLAHESPVKFASRD